jgi:hypothetical protein
MGRFLIGVVAAVFALVVIGAVAIKLLGFVLSLAWYIIIGALVVGGAVWLYSKARRSVGPGTRWRNRIDAANQTYKQRKY